MGFLFRALPWFLGALAAVAALGPALGPGYVLRYDMVFVPDLSLATVLAGADGFPRAMPSDAVVAALSLVLPGDVVQSLALAAVFVLGFVGAFRILSGAVRAAGGPDVVGAAAGAAAGLSYVWNPFVAERLLLGQWAVLLGYAGLPWVLAAVVRASAEPAPRGLAGTLRALIPAAVGGFSSVALSALTAGPQALLGPRRWRTAGTLVAALVLVSLPWLVPSLTSGATTDPAGVEAFAARADTPFGVLGSLLLSGGVWNAGAVPPGYGEPVAAAARALLVAVSLAGWVWWTRRHRPAMAAGLSVAAVAGTTIALAGATGPGREVLTALIGWWPGFGLLRDGQLYVAPLALLQALGSGAVLVWLLRGFSEDARRGSGPSRNVSEVGLVRTMVAVFVALGPVVVLPGLAWGAGGGLVPVDYPREWTRAQEAVAADPGSGAVLVLPWSAYRGVEWSGRPVVVLDPATRLFDRRTVWNDDLRVGTPDGGTVVVAGEDARAREAARLLEPDPRTGMPTADPGEWAEILSSLGVSHVAVSAPVDNRFSSDFPGLETVVQGDDMTLLEVRDQHMNVDKEGISGLEVTGGLVTVGAIIWSMARSGSSLGFQRPQPRTDRGARKEIPK
ncbi:hypothetical protein GTW20_06600 [Nocardiopsis alba]|uniref:Uncharacterized protein n=1 Tax=Nocardiopsis alba TaxID=53437 RepID=A0A7K2IPT9_9ACTN|nr:hypothetical protein [Nocardiopsis alba]MYR31953.1 hypothetical protein [Nocardiopsis alba]